MGHVRPVLVSLLLISVFALQLSIPVRGQYAIQGQLTLTDESGTTTTQVYLGDTFSLTSSVDDLSANSTPVEQIVLYIYGPFFTGTPNPYGGIAVTVWQHNTSIPAGEGRGFRETDPIDTNQPIQLLTGGVAKWEVGSYYARLYWQPTNSSDNRIDLVGNTQVDFTVAQHAGGISWWEAAILAAVVVGGVVVVYEVRQLRVKRGRKKPSKSTRSTERERRRSAREAARSARKRKREAN